MSVSTAFAEFVGDEEYVRDGVVYSDNLPVGILAPTTLLGMDEHGNMHVNGRNGQAQMEVRTRESFWESIIASDAVLFGSPSEVQQVQALLEDRNLSRTAAYFSTLPGGCADLIRRMRNIAKARVLVVGCGGIGSLSAMNMAGAGVAQMTLIDHDTVEDTNLNRQFFWKRSDQDRFKIDVLKEVMLEKWPAMEVSIHKHGMGIEAIKTLLPQHDVAIVTADEPLGLSVEIAEDSPIFVAAGGYFHGQLGYFARSPHAQAPRLLRAGQVRWQRNPHFIAPSSGPGNTEIAGVISSACLHYLADQERHVDTYLNQVWRCSRLI